MDYRQIILIVIIIVLIFVYIYKFKKTNDTTSTIDTLRIDTSSFTEDQKRQLQMQTLDYFKTRIQNYNGPIDKLIIEVTLIEPGTTQ